LKRFGDLERISRKELRELFGLASSSTDTDLLGHLRMVYPQFDPRPDFISDAKLHDYSLSRVFVTTAKISTFEDLYSFAFPFPLSFPFSLTHPFFLILFSRYGVSASSLMGDKFTLSQLRALGFSNTALFKTLYPQFTFLDWSFNATPRSPFFRILSFNMILYSNLSSFREFWESPVARRAFLDKICHEVKVERLSDVYTKITTDVIKRCGGGGLLYSKYSNSVSALVRDVYPEMNLEPWRFKVAPFEYWKDDLEMQRVLRFVETSIGMIELEECVISWMTAFALFSSFCVLS
jgi:hypothetical protein